MYLFRCILSSSRKCFEKIKQGISLLMKWIWELEWHFVCLWIHYIWPMWLMLLNLLPLWLTRLSLPEKSSFFNAGSSCKETEDQHIIQKLQELYQKLDSIAKCNLFRQKWLHARLQFCHTMVLLFCVWLWLPAEISPCCNDSSSC